MVVCQSRYRKWIKAKEDHHKATYLLQRQSWEMEKQIVGRLKAVVLRYTMDLPPLDDPNTVRLMNQMKRMEHSSSINDRNHVSGPRRGMAGLLQIRKSLNVVNPRSNSRVVSASGPSRCNTNNDNSTSTSNLCPSSMDKFGALGSHQKWVSPSYSRRYQHLSSAISHARYD
jgi:hypothetical protein